MLHIILKFNLVHSYLLPKLAYRLWLWNLEAHLTILNKYMYVYAVIDCEFEEEQKSQNQNVFRLLKIMGQAVHMINIL